MHRQDAETLREAWVFAMAMAEVMTSGPPCPNSLYHGASQLEQGSGRVCLSVHQVRGCLSVCFGKMEKSVYAEIYSVPGPTADTSQPCKPMP